MASAMFLKDGTTLRSSAIRELSFEKHADTPERAEASSRSLELHVTNSTNPRGKDDCGGQPAIEAQTLLPRDLILALQGALCGQVLHTSCVLGVCSCWPGPGAMSPAAGSGERAGKGRQQCLNDGAVPLGNCSRVLQPTCPSFRRRLASWTCCDASWTICTSACCSTTAAWAAALQVGSQPQ